MGSVFRVPVYRTSTDTFFETMRALDTSIYAAALTDTAVTLGGVPLDRCAVVIGNEGRGVRAECMARCDRTVIIPMTGNAESLNAAVAAAILMWEMSKCQ